MLNGKSAQNVYFGNCPTLNEIYVTNPDKREIIWNGNMNVTRLGSDINVKSENLKLGNIDIAGLCMVVNGDCSIAGGCSVDIDGGLLTINGDLNHSTGTIICNNGTLNINGTYYMENASLTDDGKPVLNGDP
ncbi:hypothetical protein RASY3_18015 [Ruminococcus albus SY3]|uniref:Uncharacterized protein n=1 Tax=Ruminococcus albus SY3 TaxID=1341156 RepID=A0A011VTT0_RUMAL|nr:hypothetical protein [Ruminococcus albus]EXM38666.1 hypothetical protein RASY3_18015 [Ruminococcus albus SY3]